MEYRIDELARTAGTTVRNVRVYQDRALLPPPRRQGRAAVYSDAHLARLRLIMNMLERGYALAQIKEMLDAWQAGRGLADILGLEEAMGVPWAEESVREISGDAPAEMFGDQLTEANLTRAIELGLIERQQDCFVTRAPQLLDAAAELVSLGMPFDVVLDLAEKLQHDVDDIAGLLTRAVRQYVLCLGDGCTAREMSYYSDVLNRLRPLAMKALGAAAARSAEGVIPDVLGDRLVELAERAGRPEAPR